MKCDRCEQDAKLMIHTIDAQQEEKTLHLCLTCAQEMFIQGVQGNDAEMFAYFQDSLKQLLGSFFEETETENEKRCGFCQSTFNDIINTGRFGCDHCYTEFFDKARQTLKMAQGASKHKGATPVNYSPYKENPKEEMQALLVEKKEALDACIEEENYERAAILRDEMRELTEALAKE